jgi:2-amino-4-hydroxy-6-hydroxymethyldihydropteridine diphosphokinase
LPQVLLGFGGNLGDPAATIEAALARLGASGVAILARSGFYRTQPWGPVAQPDFINLCAVAETALPPCALLALTQALERELGREPGPRWGPRPLDIDILDYGGLVLEQADLVLPHPRMCERAFVLVPLAEIAPERMVAGRKVREWAEASDRTGMVRIGPAAPKPGD